MDNPVECPRCKRVDWMTPKGSVPASRVKILGVGGWKAAVQDLDRQTAVVKNPEGEGWIFLRHSGGKVTLVAGVPLSAYKYGPFSSEEEAWKAGHGVVLGEKR